MNKYQKLINRNFLFFLLVFNQFFYAQTDQAPIITAQGNQAFCHGNSINIVTDFTITDADDTTIDSFFIQISTGYQVTFDKLELSVNYPSISSTWSSSEGKLTLKSSIAGAEMLLTDLENAVKDVVYTTTANTITSQKNFSLSIGDANYLPSTDHFYEFISDEGITWSNAKTAAQNRTYYGRQGYLATLTSKEEADFAGKQASGAGWIGGSDEESEGVWKWVTGPEAGTVFWNGHVNGSTPNFAFWNNNEPNDFQGAEDYAHITDPSIGIPGAWNDLPNIGGTNLYVPRGYIVEYGKPGDAPLNIVASTSIYIPQITSTTDATICESGVATLTANANEGIILWFDALTGGTQLFKGTNFTTPIINTSKTYYATVSVNGCTTLNRTAVTATVYQKPTITSTTDALICSGTAVLKASTSIGQINWYDSDTSTTPIFTGTTFTTPVLNTTTTYYVAPINANCNFSITRTPVTAIVDTKTPEFDLMQDTYVLCNDLGTVTLETMNPEANYSYVWTKDGTLLAENNAKISVSSIGNYTVSAISEAGCISQEKNILVRNSQKSNLTKDDIYIVDNANNNTIYVTNSNLGIGEYEFALDNQFGLYKEQGFFENISIGIHTLYIKDKLGCGIQEYQFSILSYPKFFTPNEDGDNDVWQIKGYDTNFYTLSEIYIYDRFGKLIFTIDKNNKSWNGNSENRKLPSNDYWFKTILTDINGYSIEKTGNFSLIRN